MLCINMWFQFMQVFVCMWSSLVHLHSTSFSILPQSVAVLGLALMLLIPDCRLIKQLFYFKKKLFPLNWYVDLMMEVGNSIEYEPLDFIAVMFQLTKKSETYSLPTTKRNLLAAYCEVENFVLSCIASRCKSA